MKTVQISLGHPGGTQHTEVAVNLQEEAGGAAGISLGQLIRAEGFTPLTEVRWITLRAPQKLNLKKEKVNSILGSCIRSHVYRGNYSHSNARQMAHV